MMDGWVIWMLVGGVLIAGELLFIAGDWKVIVASNSASKDETIRRAAVPKGKYRWLIAAHDESRQYLMCSRITP